jgi:bifunctional non-homologous end joining protein LigD
VEHLEAEGALVHRNGCAMGLEGIIAKVRDAPYRSGRSATWIKAKCNQQGRFVVVGFVPAPGSIAALRLARKEDGKLLYVGKVGTGFDNRIAADIRRKLNPLARRTAPLTKPIRRPDTQWVEPSYAADVEYLEAGEDGRLRHPSFRELVPPSTKR